MSGNPRNAGPRPDARRDFALLNVGWRFHPALHGLFDLANHTVLPEIALAKVSEDAPIPKSVEGDLAPYLVDLTRGGADYTFDATGNVGVMRDALESAHKGWGESIIIGVAPAGAEISTRSFQLVIGRSWRGTAFGGARGRTDVPKIVYWYMDGKIEIDPMITHTMCLDDINHGFDLMHKGVSI